MDNWFTSVNLAEELLKFNLSVVGTIKKIKPEIPPQFQANKKRESHHYLVFRII